MEYQQPQTPAPEQPASEPSPEPAKKELTKKQKVLLEVGGIALVLLVALVAMGGLESPSEEPEVLEGETVVEVLEDTEIEEEESPAPAPVAPSKAGALTYEEMIQLYAGKRFQFTSCRGNPGSMTMTPGTAFVIDNRDTKAHTIRFAGRAYTLSGLGWRIVTAPGRGTHGITCDGGGSAQLIVQ